MVVSPGGERYGRWRCAFLILFCVAISAPADGEYRTVEIEALRITMDSDWGLRNAPGYLPVRFDITNLGEARTLEIVGHGTRFFRSPRHTSPATVNVFQIVRLARGDRVRLTLPVPIFADSENIRFEIREDDRTLERFNFGGVQSGTVPGDASALIVADQGGAFGKRAVGWARKITTGAHLSGFVVRPGGTTTGTSAPPLDFVLDPPRVPTNWLGFTSLRAVVIGPTEWEQLNDAQKTALLTWTACGGDLLFVDGALKMLFPSGGLAASGPDPAARAYFFGRIHLPTSDSIEAAGLSAALLAAEKVQDANWALPANRAADWADIAARGFRLPIPGIDGIPARAYLSILLVFSLLIGPVNYWFLWRKRQQVLLVLTAPLISAVFILLLAGYVVAGEGLGIHGRVVTFTILDQTRNQASTRASISLYAAGMTPGGGMRFARDIAVYPIGPDGKGSRESQTLDLTDAQHFPAGFIQARSPTNFEEIGFRPARERLSFSREAGVITVMNGLGVRVTALLYRDGGIVYNLLDPLPPGGTGMLKAGAVPARNLVPTGLPLSSRFLHLIDHQPDRSYFAILERSPFWDPGVKGVNERGSFHLVIGWPEGQP